jgi:hypothetical protein
MWVFGESFSYHYKKSKYFNHLEDSWVERTGRSLNQEIIPNAKHSITIEYVFHKFNEQRNNIKENDICIIALPYIDRRWFFQKHLLKIFYLNDDENEALENYKEHLNYFDDLHKVYTINFLYNVNYLTKKLNLHTIVLLSFYDSEEIIEPLKDEFDSINFSKGTISGITINELKKESLNDETNLWLQKNDPRVNHLCRNNHITLSNKIIDNVLHKSAIDLTLGFENNFLDKILMQDPKFIEDQLFGGIMTRLQRIKVNRS